MYKRFERAEQLLNNRQNIIMNVPDAGPADQAYLNGAAAMVKALGFDFFQRDGKFEILAPETIDGNKTPMFDLLDNVNKFLEAYKLTNDGILDDADEYDLGLALTTVKILQRHSAELDIVTAND